MRHHFDVSRQSESVLVSAVQELLDSSPPKPEPSVPVLSEQSIPAMRRSEDKIREICAQLFAMKDDTAHSDILAQLHEDERQSAWSLIKRG
jgi:hypothetical protein